MTKVIVQHSVADYETWFAVFTQHGEVRRRHGATGHSVSRSAADPNSIVIVNEFATLEGATAFSQDPSLPQAMGRAGVTSVPQVWIVNEADYATY